MTITTEISLDRVRDLDLHEGDSIRVLAEKESSLLVQISHRKRNSAIVLKGRRGFPVVTNALGAQITDEDVARLEESDDFRHFERGDMGSKP